MSIFDDMRSLQQEINELGMGVPKPADLAAQLREAQARVAALEAENRELRELVEAAIGFEIGNLTVSRIFMPGEMWLVAPTGKITGTGSVFRDKASAIAAARALAGKEGE